MKFPNFFKDLFGVFFALLDPDLGPTDQSQCGSMRIWIRSETLLSGSRVNNTDLKIMTLWSRVSTNLKNITLWSRVSTDLKNITLWSRVSTDLKNMTLWSREH